METCIRCAGINSEEKAERNKAESNVVSLFLGLYYVVNFICSGGERKVVQEIYVYDCKRGKICVDISTLSPLPS